MVHVLGEVLRRTHRSLRAGGFLLVIQPTPANSLIELEIGGELKFSQELQMPNFLGYLKATEVSLAKAVGDGLYAIEVEATTPDEGQYHCSEYSSLDEWIEDWKPFCEDLTHSAPCRLPSETWWVEKNTDFWSTTDSTRSFCASVDLDLVSER